MPKWEDEDDAAVKLPPPNAAGAGNKTGADAAAGASNGAGHVPGPDTVLDTRDQASGLGNPPARDMPPGAQAEKSDEKIAEPLTPIDQSEQIFDRPGSVRVGILGGTGVGKSYLFQAMVYRIWDPGILHRYVRNSKPSILSALTSGGKPASVPPVDFITDYQAWHRLPPTRETEQRWYRVSLTFNTGLLGRRLLEMDVHFLDGSGEALETGVASPAMRAVWDRAFKEATIMVFCLPIWVLFPNSEAMTDLDWETRDYRLAGFDRLVATYGEIRNRSLKVRTILALTMADDDRSALRTLRRRWIDPCVNRDSADKFFKKLKRPWAVPRYLASAREVSEYIYRELDSVRTNVMVKNIYRNLMFGHGRPWIIPMSAVDGEEVAKMEPKWKAWDKADNDKRGSKPRSEYIPNPAHVELPLLAAMVEWKNALM